MNKGTLAILHSVSDYTLTRIREAASGWEIVYAKTDADWADKLPNVEIACGWRSQMTERCLGAGTQLKWVQTWGAGVDRMPLEQLARAGVAVTTASGVHANPISETVFAMMLAFSRALHAAVRSQMSGAWQLLPGLSEIHGRTIGIVGVGAIGSEVARLAKAFQMRVLGVRRSGEPAEYVDRMYDTGGLEAVLRESDYVVDTLPLTERTRHLFGREQFAMMKPSARFINIGRGATADTEALMEALRAGRIAGAGLDVFEQEPLPPDHPLWTMDNVIITPHNSGATDLYEERAADIFLTNLHAYLRDRSLPLNLVDPVLQY